MHAISKLLACAVASAIAAAAVAQNQVTSAYSPLTDAACSAKVDDSTTGAQTMECPGVHGYRLRVTEDDERSSVDVVTPDGRSFALNFWDVVTRGFSTLGSHAEWRSKVVNGTAIPFAVIVGVNALDQRDPDNPHPLPLLAVARISRDEVCVTHRIDAAHPGATSRARIAAAQALAPCLRDTAKP
ncbi:hypothetical protein [Pseudoduganella chitinolytica]|uniref:DUF3455 domain-containing protein n=1 Tax=Pseudoduganella chitinolytica TaxID=34070 RepID=A0ABY8BE67_9BURK|nr:hypothetical protein [Pseudoduganella chitinolytica]WEF33543.1 hypothetical protein PX653_01755 [Pseudoduganella chitinolytica]